MRLLGVELRRAFARRLTKAVIILSIAGMGGLVCVLVKGNFADYAALLKYLGFAGAIKSGWEHHVKTRKGAAQSAA